MSKTVDKDAMRVYNQRLQTFDGWPYTEGDGAKCTAEKLAESGFYRPMPESEPDLARCFMCQKDLEGWEPNDDPDSEHKSHSSKCPFLSLKVRKLMDMKISDFIKLLYSEEIQKLSHLANTAVKDAKEEQKKYLNEKLNIHQYCD